MSEAGGEGLAWLRKEFQDHLTRAAILSARGYLRLAVLHRRLAAAKRLTLLRAGEKL